MDADKRNTWKLENACMDFVEVNKEGTYDLIQVEISAEDKAYVTQELTNAYQRIKNHEFTTGCGKPECTWCNFVVKNAPLKLTFAEDEEY